MIEDLIELTEKKTSLDRNIKKAYKNLCTNNPQFSALTKISGNRREIDIEIGGIINTDFIRYSCISIQRSKQNEEEYKITIYIDFEGKLYLYDYLTAKEGVLEYTISQLFEEYKDKILLPDEEEDMIGGDLCKLP